MNIIKKIMNFFYRFFKSTPHVLPEFNSTFQRFKVEARKRGVVYPKYDIWIRWGSEQIFSSKPWSNYAGVAEVYSDKFKKVVINPRYKGYKQENIDAIIIHELVHCYWLPRVEDHYPKMGNIFSAGFTDEILENPWREDLLDEMFDYIKEKVF